MATKEEILKTYDLFNHIDDNVNETHIYFDNALLAMDEYAKQECGDFAEWLNMNRWYTYDYSKNVWYYSFEHVTAISDANYLKNYTKTTEELYNIYLKQKNK